MSGSLVVGCALRRWVGVGKLDSRGIGYLIIEVSPTFIMLTREAAMSKFLLHLVGIIFLLNVAISTWNLLVDGLSWMRIIPAVCWLIATILWYTLKVFRTTASSPSES